MDQTQLQQKIALYYSKLPENLQQFFAGMNWINTLQEISVKNNLSEEQIKTLSTETTLILLCIVSIEDYVKMVESELKLSKEQADTILAEINEKIFKDIGYEIEETFTKNINSLAEEKYGGDKKLDERFASLPKEVQIAINESDYQATLYSIASKYKLSIEQMGTLEEVTTKVMLNIIHPDQYENELISKIKIPREDISSLVKDINEQILKTIRELLKSSWDKNSNVDTDIVPIPPYKKTINQENVLNTNKEIVPKTEILKTLEQTRAPEKIVFEAPKPKEGVVEILKAVTPIEVRTQNKPAMVVHNIFEEKLKAPTISHSSVSDHSVSQISQVANKIIDSNTNPTAKTVDPYREAF
jgi:hypothetical protein